MLTKEDLENYRVVDLGYNDWTTLTLRGSFSHNNAINIRNINGNFQAILFTKDGWQELPRTVHPFIVGAAFPKRIATFYLDEYGNER